MASRCPHAGVLFDLKFITDGTDRRPGKLIIGRALSSNPRLQQGKSCLSTDVDKLVRNSSGKQLAGFDSGRRGTRRLSMGDWKI
jgi:hypothetical protein